MGEQPQTHEAHSKAADGLGIREAVSRPLTVVFLGAGSGFFEKLFADLLFVPGTACGGEMRLVDIDPERLELARRMGEKVVEAMGAPWTVRASTDRRAMPGHRPSPGSQRPWSASRSAPPDLSHDGGRSSNRSGPASDRERGSATMRWS